jgi:hypothetical protein
VRCEFECLCTIVCVILGGILAVVFVSEYRACSSAGGMLVRGSGPSVVCAPKESLLKEQKE